MKSRLTWTGARTFLGQTDSGHSIAIGNAHEDTPKPGPSAMELILMPILKRMMEEAATNTRLVA